ncbi:hypothetical protein BDV93DRAFT_519403 [Ceratobasidium sp. AG-I]|nr:hypothetical protein BDV93DRAFT_519403 [Ceratobasidium sp. AG-I]
MPYLYFSALHHTATSQPAQIFITLPTITTTTYAMSSYTQSSSSASTSSVSHHQSRDYSAAFGALASSYGSSGAAPCPSSSKTVSHLASAESSLNGARSFFSRQHAGSPTSSAPLSEKHVARKSQEYGALMDKYGASVSIGSYGRL